jgi:predicted outer membrane lipoprotein
VAPSDLANRFSNYADAVVAFAVLNVLGFMSALGDEDLRSTIGETSRLPFILGVLGAAVFYTLLALVFRHAELQLREEAGEVSTARVEKYQRYFQIARIAVIWLSSGLAILAYF